MKARIKFSKTGALRYIGHLDVLRYFQKAIRRSGLAASYSKGFSPHMIMSFAEPLGVGLTSIGEYFDIEFDYDDPYEKTENHPCPSEKEMLEALNAEMADGIRVLSVRRLEPGKKSNAMSLVAAAAYTVSFPMPGDEERTLAKILEDFAAQSEVIAEKKTKSGMKTEDIRPLIFSMKETALPGEDAGEESNAAFRLFCSSGSAANLKADAVFRALCSFAGWKIEPWDVHIRRDELYAKDEKGKYIPLQDLGQKL